MARQKPQLQTGTVTQTEVTIAAQLPVPARPQVSPEIEQQIRQLAYQLYEQRGCEDGHHERDWIEAEAIILGKKEKLAA